jgi:hypothetical protein
MLAIVAHHYVVNSGLAYSPGAPMNMYPESFRTYYLCFFGMWGKTGINCFLMITGYFMCKSQITWRKFIKLLAWIYTYNFVLYALLLYAGYESVSPLRIAKLFMPMWGFGSGFTSCFLAFYLTIPFENMLIQSMTRRQHLLLIGLMLFFYTLLGSIPFFGVSFNYITWFGIIYLIASYIRLYPSPVFNNKRMWRNVSLSTILLAVLSVVLFHNSFFGVMGYDLVADSNKFFAVAVAVTTFLWFKNMDIPYNKWINTIGGSTFGVLLIHANSDAMRKWLWSDTVNCVGHYSLSVPRLVAFSIIVVLVVFCVCSAIDRVRKRFIEEPFFRWFDEKNIGQRLSERGSALLQKIVKYE